MDLSQRLAGYPATLWAQVQQLFDDRRLGPMRQLEFDVRLNLIWREQEPTP